MSEGGLFNGVLSIHREFECRLLVCLHDGSAASFLVGMQEEDVRIKSEKKKQRLLEEESRRVLKRKGALELFRMLIFFFTAMFELGLKSSGYL